MTARILLVEDDQMARQLLANVLIQAGYEVTQAADGTIAIRLLEEYRFDVVLSDIYMAAIDGIAVMHAARNHRSYAPEVILLTGYGSLETAIAALRSGAYNYLLKPCATDELLDCVAGAVKRRLPEQHQDEIANDPGRYLSVRGLQLDLHRHSALLDGQPLHLTPTEFILLRCLAEAPECVLSCTEIVQQTHGYMTSESEAQILLRTHVRNLRLKIPKKYLVTVRNTGYMLVGPRDSIMQMNQQCHVLRLN